MAQSDTEKILIDCDADKEIEGSPPLKKLKQLDLKQMKQGRLPFKPVDVKPKTGLGNTPPSSKKRKLSDGESPSAKPPKTPKSQTKVVPEMNESEVSSSSEADHQTRKSKIRNTLERFVCKTSQEEISSTNDGVDSTEAKAAPSPICVESDESDTEKENIPKKPPSKSSVKTTPAEPEKKKEEQQEDLNEDNCQSAEEADDEEEKMQEDVESSTSPDCSTPSKGKASDSLLKTPTSKMSDSLMQTPKSASDLSCSDSTPGTAKRAPRRLSDAKRKEREALRQKVKDEKEKMMEEKRQKKEQERLEKEREKERVKKERDEAKAEKEKQKQEEKLKREKERQEKMAQKEEEKKKKQEILEAKQEEKRKKEEEKRLKEEEKQKEEEEKRQKEQKLKESFTSFFIKPKTSPTSKTSREPMGMFMPFEVKKDMSLAPATRRQELNSESQEKLDQSLQNQNTKELYLSELKSGKTKPRKIRAISDRKEEEDVVLVHDSETVKSITYHCKLLQFHMNYRPPYYGTWRKKSKKLSPRNPFKMDTELFDYEVDSDDEWEEEEPGESLSASEGEEEENNEDDEDEDAGWMVPHGYLSEGEGCEDDEDDASDLRMRCRKKLEQWEMELKRQTQPALPVIIGCFWEHAVHQLQKDLEEKLAIYKTVPLAEQPINTSFTGGKSQKADSTPSDKKEEGKKTLCKPVPEEAMPDLIRLVHGNLAGIKKLVKEFRLYWKHKTTGKQAEVEKDTEENMEVDEEAATAENLKSVDGSENKDSSEVKLAPEPVAEVDFSISKRQLEIKITSIATREKRDLYKKICWYVNDSVLEQYNLKDLPIPSAWEFISQPKKTPLKPKPEEPVNSGRKTPTVSITQFARPMSPSTIQAQFAAANASAIANKQKQTEEQAVKVIESPQSKPAAPKEEITGKPDQTKLNFFSPTRPHQWKMAPSTPGSSQGDRKRLVLVPSHPGSRPKQQKEDLKDVSNTIQNKTKPEDVEKKKVVELQSMGENSKEAIVLD